MWITIFKMLLTALAEDSVKRIIKDTIKDKLTSKTKTDFDDGLVDVIFNSKSKGELSKNIINYGAISLLNSDDDTISNDTVKEFLSIAQQSKGNGITSNVKNTIKMKLAQTEDKLFYKEGTVK